MPVGIARIADGSIDLTLLVDTVPYLLLSEGELVGRYLAEISGVLRTGGDVLILNFSYRDDIAADRTDLEQLAARCGLSLVEAAARPCESWDAAAFRLVRCGALPASAQ
ncbi:MAG TPA: hypothetical protein VFN79_05250 [Steroidobacteraceae bacterium]|nr:hypothetical protein [Steroidobacteraceae bacterium]